MNCFIKRLLSFIFLITTILSYGQSTIISKEFSPEELKEDLHYLFNSLESIHPSLYANAGKSVIELELKKIEAELERPMTRLEFAKKVIPLVTKLKDAHTSLTFPIDERNAYVKNNGKVFPFETSLIAGQLLISKNYSEDPALVPGTEIISINNIPTPEIIDSLKQFVSAELEFYSEIRIQRAFRRLLWYVFGFVGDYELQIMHSGQVEGHFVKGIASKELEAMVVKGGGQTKIKPYSFYKLPDSSIGVIDFRVMQDRRKFGAFLDSTFAVVKKDGLQSIVIDIRDNGGGDSRLVDQLFDYITDKQFRQAISMEIKTSSITKKSMRKKYLKWFMYPAYPFFFFAGKQARAYTFKRNGTMTVIKNDKLTTPKEVSNKFSGKTYLLTSHYTFSSANILADAYKCYQIGTIVGEETGGVLTAYGDIITVILPNTQLNAYCSHKKFVHPGADGQLHGVRPDIEVKTTIDDIRSGKDAPMEYLKELIRK